jgi:hypothetical protein
MMRDCPKLVQDRVAALVAHETCDTRDTFAFIAQGMPIDLEQPWDSEEVRLYCLELIMYQSWFKTRTQTTTKADNDRPTILTTTSSSFSQTTKR